MKGDTMDLNKTQRTAILAKIEKTVAEKYYDPAFDPNEWQSIVNRHWNAIIDTSTVEGFENAVRTMLGEFSPRALGLLSKRTPINPRNAINASFSVQSLSDGLRWVFQDVLPGGVAAQAGLKTGDVLLSVAEGDMCPAAQSSAEPPFEMANAVSITVRRGNTLAEYTLQTGNPKYKDNPYSDLKAVTASSLEGDIGYLRVSLFQGKVGIDFANELDSLFSGRFASTKALIIDLRGNPGGGIGGLALMSYLTPDKLPVGYSKNRKMAQEGIHPSSLPVFGRVPRSRLAIPALALKFMKKTSVFLSTEGLGAKAYNAKVVILVNEHSTGAAEMVTQFAQENHLATVVGTKTPGRLVSRSGFKLGFDYTLVVPVAAYVSAKGQQIEGNGISPDLEIPWSFADAAAGKDNQLAAAIGVLSQQRGF